MVLRDGESLNLVGLRMTMEVWREGRGRWMGLSWHLESLEGVES